MNLLKILIYYPLLNLIALFAWLVPGHHAIWGIIGVTVVVRSLLLIPTAKQYESQRKLQQIQPIMQKLQKEHAGDQQALAQAQMKLYKENGVNPLGSCLPLLIQLPILLALNHAIMVGLRGDGVHLYSWVPRVDMQTVLFGIDLAKPDATLIFPIIAAILQFLQMELMLKEPYRLILKKRGLKPEGEIDQSMATQRSMALVMPLLTLFIARNFSAGLAIYWSIATIFSIAQWHFVSKKRMQVEGLKEVVDTIEHLHDGEDKVVVKKEKKKDGTTVTVRKPKKK